MAYMRQAVVTIEEPNGHLRYASLPVYLYSDVSTVDTEAIVEIARIMARTEAGEEQSLILNGWEKRSYE